MIKTIKTKLFNILSNKYPDYQIIDNMSMAEDRFPCLQIRLGGISRDRYRGNFRQTIRYQIHIFSDYDGEQEVLDIESEIFDALEQFYEIDGISYVRADFTLIDDKKTGPVRKHGIITVIFTCEGKQQEVENEQSG